MMERTTMKCDSNQSSRWRSQAQGYEAETDVVDFGFAEFAAMEIWRVLNQARGEQQRDDSDRDVDEENPAPGEVVGDPSAEGGADGGSGDNGDAVDGEGHAAFGGRESVGEDGLFAGLEAASASALQHAADDERGQVWRESAEERTDGEQRHAAHVEILAADDGGEPAAQRQHDGIRYKIGSEDPGALVLSGGEAAGDVRQGDVGDGSVEYFHESRQRHGDGDDPRIYCRTPVVDVGVGIGAIQSGGTGTHCLIQTLGVTDMPGRSEWSLFSPGLSTIFTGMR